jgi:tRNA(Ile)-lysidine synthase
VRELATGLGVPFQAARVAAGRRDHRSPEARARELRYAALERIRTALCCSWIATAHSLDDQAETVLLRAIRGTGLSGLTGIGPRLDSARVLRPVLGVRGRALREYLSARGLAWCEDETNVDLSIPRNRLRREVLPALEEVHAGAAEKLAALARRARESEADGESAIERALGRALSRGDGGLWIDPLELEALGRAGCRRALLALFSEAGLGDRVTTGHLTRVEKFLGAPQGAPSLSLPGDRVLFRDAGQVWLGPGPGPSFPSSVSASLGPPDPLEFPERGMRLSWRRTLRSSSTRDALSLPAEPSPSLRIRSPRTGDRITLPGHRSAKPLVELFRSARWSRRQRARALVVEANGEVLWVPGLTGASQSSDDPVGGWQLVFERLSSEARSW